MMGSIGLDAEAGAAACSSSSVTDAWVELPLCFLLDEVALFLQSPDGSVGVLRFVTRPVCDLVTRRAERESLDSAVAASTRVGSSTR